MIKIEASHAYCEKLTDQAYYLDVMYEKRRALILEIRAAEEDALKRAVCRFFKIENAFDAVKDVSCVVDHRGNRRYESIHTGEVIIRFLSLRMSNDNGLMRGHMDYKTFDGIK